MKKQDTFEKTYKKYPFAPLVVIGVRLAALIAGSTKPHKTASHREAGRNGKSRPGGGVVGQAA